MATGTLTFIPNADISVSHNKSSGSTGYSLLTSNDGDSSYIYQTLNSTSSTSVSSVFTLGIDGDMPTEYFEITAARLYSRARIGNNDESGSYYCYFAAGTTAGGSDTNASTSATLNSSYATSNSTSSSLVAAINELIAPNEFPTLSVKVTTTGRKSSGKNASNGYIRVTQIYLELDYETKEYVPDIPDIPSEDPTETYHSITVSSINATTNPANGTIRVVEGSDQTITITPTDPQLTLALDNGVDITSQLQGGIPNNTYTIDTQVSGASYGFNLNNSTGYYVSTNNGVNKSASVARLNMNFESECLVTIQYINYAEENYDYGMFGKLDTAVATDGLTASSNSSSPSDSLSNYQLAMASNRTNTQTITYQVPIGQHFIDIKYGKDDASNSGNDNLQ